MRRARAQKRLEVARVREEPTLRRVFAPIPLSSHKAPALVRFPPLVGPCIDLVLFPEVNAPQHLNLDVACFMMLIGDLADLFGIMAHPANLRVKVRDLPQFSDWLHVISDPVVVRVFKKSDADHGGAFIFTKLNYPPSLKT